MAMRGQGAGMGQAFAFNSKLNEEKREANMQDAREYARMNMMENQHSREMHFKKNQADITNALNNAKFEHEKQKYYDNSQLQWAQENRFQQDQDFENQWKDAFNKQKYQEAQITLNNLKKASALANEDKIRAKHTFEKNVLALNTLFNSEDKDGNLYIERNGVKILNPAVSRAMKLYDPNWNDRTNVTMFATPDARKGLCFSDDRGRMHIVDADQLEELLWQERMQKEGLGGGGGGFATNRSSTRSSYSGASSTNVSNLKDDAYVNDALKSMYKSKATALENGDTKASEAIQAEIDKLVHTFNYGNSGGNGRGTPTGAGLTIEGGAGLTIEGVKFSQEQIVDALKNNMPLEGNGKKFSIKMQKDGQLSYVQIAKNGEKGAVSGIGESSGGGTGSESVKLPGYEGGAKSSGEASKEDLIKYQEEYHDPKNRLKDKEYVNELELRGEMGQFDMGYASLDKGDNIRYWFEHPEEFNNDINTIMVADYALLHPEKFSPSDLEIINKFRDYNTRAQAKDGKERNKINPKGWNLTIPRKELTDEDKKREFVRKNYAEVDARNKPTEKESAKEVAPDQKQSKKTITTRYDWTKKRATQNMSDEEFDDFLKIFDDGWDLSDEQKNNIVNNFISERADNRGKKYGDKDTTTKLKRIKAILDRMNT